jgi:hypothetical protein
MLFYESAACLHGRRQVLKGKYYASVFSHYQPVDRTIWNFTTEVNNAHLQLVPSNLLQQPHVRDRFLLYATAIGRYQQRASTLDGRRHRAARIAPRRTGELPFCSQEG